MLGLTSLKYTLLKSRVYPLHNEIKPTLSLPSLVVVLCVTSVASIAPSGSLLLSSVCVFCIGGCGSKAGRSSAPRVYRFLSPAQRAAQASRGESEYRPQPPRPCQFKLRYLLLPPSDRSLPLSPSLFSFSPFSSLLFCLSFFVSLVSREHPNTQREEGESKAKQRFRLQKCPSLLLLLLLVCLFVGPRSVCCFVFFFFFFFVACLLGSFPYSFSCYRCVRPLAGRLKGIPPTP